VEDTNVCTNPPKEGGFCWLTSKRAGVLSKVTYYPEVPTKDGVLLHDGAGLWTTSCDRRPRDKKKRVGLRGRLDHAGEVEEGRRLKVSPQ